MLSYYGGKQRMSKHIIPIIDSIPHDNYVEPFFGGGAVLFAKKPSHQEIINDINDLIINLYRVAKKYPTELIQEIDATMHSKRDFNSATAIIRNPDKYASEYANEAEGCYDIIKAWAVYVAVNQGYANKIGGGWAISKTRNNVHGSTWAMHRRHLGAQIERLRKVSVYCGDAIACCEKFDAPNTLLYLDPPYPDYDQGHYSGYSEFDWAKLCEFLDGCESSYILSGYAQKAEPKSAQQRIEIPTYCSAGVDSNTSQRTEILWVCNRSEKRSDMQLSLFDSLLSVS
ncbi:DNA adenine methylase [Roseofilum sp. BLCC_M114]|uniref:DNA adenine methylase n=2 Tax=Roseofilum TaxID=1233426 RepID=A0ABT7B6A9_9CYAN|nr:DNA adenine methylase [Roseofilum capinflatum]MDJ1174703.1 DNA adenine methylase [Roseofilum capinflatum BLCC-M114]